MALTMEQFNALAPDARVVINNDLDNPFKKVDEEWFENSRQQRIRARHFSGAVQAGTVVSYEENMPRRWHVRHGINFYSVLLNENANDAATWDCLTFSVHDPEQMYRKGIYRNLSSRQQGAHHDDPADVPWESFFKALAVKVEAEQNERDAALEQLRTDAAALLEENRRLQGVVASAEALRNALRTFTENTPAREVDPF